MKKTIITLAVVSLLLGTNFKNKGSVKLVRERDYVPNEETAIKVAEAILQPILGESLRDEEPFKAQLNGKIWLVTGRPVPYGSFGGTLVIEIRKSDCKILSLMIPK